MQMWEKVAELKASFSTFYEANEIPVVPTKADIRRIIKCLELLTEYHKLYTRPDVNNICNSADSGLVDLMNIVVKVLKGALFVNYKILEPYEDRLLEECDEEL